MNVQELKVAMVRKGKSIPKLASDIGIGKKALYQKMQGITQFTQKEIVLISKTLDLNKEDIFNIFFADFVS